MKIKPAIREPKNYVDYKTLVAKDMFIYHGMLMMKIEDLGSVKQLAIDLSDGEHLSNMCGEQVLPVDAILTWTKQKE